MQAFFAALGAAALIICAVAPLHAADLGEDAKFKAIYTAEWTWRDTQFPGENDDDNGPIADHLPKSDEATQQARLAYWDPRHAGARRPEPRGPVARRARSTSTSTMPRSPF